MTDAVAHFLRARKLKQADDDQQCGGEPSACGDAQPVNQVPIQQKDLGKRDQRAKGCPNDEIAQKDPHPPCPRAVRTGHQVFITTQRGDHGRQHHRGHHDRPHREQCAKGFHRHHVVTHRAPNHVHTRHTRHHEHRQPRQNDHGKEREPADCATKAVCAE